MLNILVTGADGQLGNELRLLGVTSSNRYIFTDVSELDITDAEAVEKAVADNEAGVIINCAAYTDVERAEEEEHKAFAINCTAVKNLAEAAAQHRATLIHISTDYVFDGRSDTPYTEDMPTKPAGAYGRTKLAGEKAITKSGCRHLIFRTSWLYSEFGSNFLKKMMRLTAERDSLKVVFDQTGTPTYAADLARAIFDIVESGKYKANEGLYHFSGEGVCSWYDFAAEIAAEAGNSRCKITPCRTWEYPTEAVRPFYSVLDKSKYKRTFGASIPHWREAMKRCIARIKNNDSICSAKF